ncbi:hypothetical protein R6Q59_008918 [Mikania micrantha]
MSRKSQANQGVGTRKTAPWGHTITGQAFLRPDDNKRVQQQAEPSSVRPGNSVVLHHVRPTSVLYTADSGAVEAHGPFVVTDKQSQQKLEDDFDAFTTAKDAPALALVTTGSSASGGGECDLITVGATMEGTGEGTATGGGLWWWLLAVVAVVAGGEERVG